MQQVSAASTNEIKLDPSEEQYILFI